jgi:hypothetical protein
MILLQVTLPAAAGGSWTSYESRLIIPDLDGKTYIVRETEAPIDNAQRISVTLPELHLSLGKHVSHLGLRVGVCLG